MIIPASEILDWRDLQEKVAMFFREMGYYATTPFIVELAGRGKKEVDVHICDPRASVNQIFLAECKLWETAIPQDTVHSFHTVMHGAGANTGFIISKAGFQIGAHEAAQNTNIHLLTWEELQHKFGRQWYLHRTDVVGKVIAELETIDRIYLEQCNPVPIANWMMFSATAREEELLEILNDIRVVLLAYIGRPKTYDVPGPIDVSVYDGFPGAVKDKWGCHILQLPDVRSFFAWIETQGAMLIDLFKALRDQAVRDFETLSDSGEAAFAETLKLLAEETPLRVFRGDLGEETYQSLIHKHLTRGGGKFGLEKARR